jgi:hypothetical protein
MAQAQGQHTFALHTALKACHIPLDRISTDIITKALNDLPDYVRKHNLPYGIAHILEK